METKIDPLTNWCWEWVTDLDFPFEMELSQILQLVVASPAVHLRESEEHSATDVSLRQIRSQNVTSSESLL